MTATHWRCTCGATGTDTSTAKTDSAHPDAKHQATCRGTVITGTNAEVLARIAAGMRGAGT
jgi:hypothetical protein